MEKLHVQQMKFLKSFFFFSEGKAEKQTIRKRKKIDWKPSLRQENMKTKV